ncbi:hypothetical protein M408DRAFT_332130 [Serendipita vermifera MAFF 305830]|uniref:LSM2-LSM8 complex subunit LSM8 n=1 Tax=Serendipita vermifera MAFF 305830 TaxID=933852 RepID=A0A0C2WBF1_SERVB|nr:hypothetical protein M408DRAFT_332130 [Serendipita vermifera MAFF 305830]
MEKRVLLVMQDGRVVMGILVGWDQKSNIILSECIERRFSLESGAVDTSLGVYMVKGDQICLVGELDTGVDDATQWSEIRAEPLPALRYGET